MYLPCGVQKYIWKTGSIYGGAYFDSNNTNSIVKTDKIRRKRHVWAIRCIQSEGKTSSKFDMNIQCNASFSIHC